MKKITRYIFLYVLLAFVCMAAKPPGKPAVFEGTIHFKVTLKGANADQFASFLPKKFEYRVKGNDFRITTDNSTIKDMLVLGDKKVGYSINEAEKTAYKIDIKSGGAKDKDDKGFKPKITGTDEIIEISGFKCKKYLVETSDPGTGIQLIQSVWVTKELGINQPNVDVNTFMVQGIEGFPLKVEVNMMLYKLELLATEVKKEKLPNDTFVLPKDLTIKKFDAKQMGIKNPLGN